MSRSQVVRSLLVGGPMYDGLYDLIPAFERESGLRVEIVDRLPHPALNARVKQDFETGRADIDLLSTHTKYAPSQARWLTPIEDVLTPEDAGDLLPRPAELARIDGRLVQYPRNLDMRLLYYRRDLFEDRAAQAAFEKTHRRPLGPPETWDDLVEVAIFLSRPGLFGFLYPGRESGLFGTFYELLVSAGGDLFGPDLEPLLDAPPGIWAADRLTELHHRRRVTPRELPNWHYDEISASFRAGDAAMVCDWPGSDYLYHDPATCRVAGRVGLALLPAGFTGRRAAYAGVHSFAIPKTAANREGAGRLLRYLTSAEAQLLEARRGALPVRQSAFARIREEVSKDERQAHRLGLLARTAEEALIIPPKFAAYPDCEDAIWHALQKAMNGAVTPTDAVKEATAVIRVVMAAARGASEVH